MFRTRDDLADLYPRLVRQAMIGFSGNDVLRFLGRRCQVQMFRNAAVCQRTKWKGRSVRALNPLSDQDAQLLQAVNRGEFAITGFRNRDLREHLFAPSPDKRQTRSQTAKVTRLIRMLRAHGLVHKISKTHRYIVSPQGHEIITALINARNAKIKTLTRLAA